VLSAIISQVFVFYKVLFIASQQILPLPERRPARTAIAATRRTVLRLGFSFRSKIIDLFIIWNTRFTP
jgi:hypothetical protein